MREQALNDGQIRLLHRARLNLRGKAYREAAKSFCTYIRYCQGETPQDYSSPAVRRDAEHLYGTWCLLVSMPLGKAQEVWKEIKELLSDDTGMRELVA